MTETLSEKWEETDDKPAVITLAAYGLVGRGNRHKLEASFLLIRTVSFHSRVCFFPFFKPQASLHNSMKSAVIKLSSPHTSTTRTVTDVQLNCFFLLFFFGF